jgi:hypothetical protein
VVLRFALQIFPANSVKGFKTQPTTKELAQRAHGTECSFLPQRFHMYFLNSKLTAYKSTGSITRAKENKLESFMEN